MVTWVLVLICVIIMIIGFIITFDVFVLIVGIIASVVMIFSYLSASSGNK